MERIYEIICNYSNDLRLLDNNAMEEIIHLLKDINKIVINDVNITDKSIYLPHDRMVGAYSNNSIIIYKNELYKYVNRELYKTNLEENFSEREKCYRKNLEILYTIMHEAEHAIQIKQLFYEFSIEAKLLSLEAQYSSKMTQSVYDGLIEDGKNLIKYLKDIKDSRKLYNSLYDISFRERLANIYSTEKIIKMLSESDEKTLLELEKNILNNFKVNGYVEKDDIITAPTTTFFNKLGYSNEIDKINFNSIEFEERFILGLPLTKEEYTYVKSK